MNIDEIIQKRNKEQLMMFIMLMASYFSFGFLGVMSLDVGSMIVQTAFFFSAIFTLYFATGWNSSMSDLRNAKLTKMVLEAGV